MARSILDVRFEDAHPLLELVDARLELVAKAMLRRLNDALDIRKENLPMELGEDGSQLFHSRMLPHWDATVGPKLEPSLTVRE